MTQHTSKPSSLGRDPDRKQSPLRPAEEPELPLHRPESTRAQSTLDSLSARVCVLDAHGTILAVNRAWRESIGVNGPPWQGLREGANFFRFCEAVRGPGSGGVDVAAAIRGVLRGEKDEFVFEYPCSSTGQERWFVARVTRFFEGDQVRLVVSHEECRWRSELEERIREEASLSERLNRLGRTLSSELDQRRVIQVVTDEATHLVRAAFGAFVFTSPAEREADYALCTLSGVPREAGTSLPLPPNTSLFGPTLRGEGPLRLDDVTRDPRFGGKAHPGTPSGPLTVRSYLAVPVVSRSGDVLGGLFFGHPGVGVFTERDERLVVGMAAQAAVAIDHARLYQQAKEAVEQVAKRNEELAQAARRKDEFLVMLAHELRNPLAPIRNAVSIARRRGEERRSVVQQAWGMVERQVAHLTRLVNDLLEVSRLTRGLPMLQPAELDLVEQVQLIVEDHRATFEQARLSLELTCPKWPLYVVADSTRLAQILDNLLENAAKFTPVGGEVRVNLTVDEARERAVITVRDTGIGIEPKLLPHLFDSFTQADHTLDRTQGGLGLGLALVKGLVELHGGGVRVHSEGPGRGAEFTVELPWQPTLNQVPERPAPPPNEPVHLRVLVVEDNRDSADSLCLLLRLFGHEVQVAYSGPAGVDVARQWKPDVVLCDIGLPGLDGYGVVGELRRDPVTARSQMIAVTGYGGEDDRRRAREAGFDQHFTKPVDPNALQELFASTASAAS